MILELSGDYLKAEDCKGGEIVEFIDAGVEAELTSPEGKTKKVVNFRIEVNKEAKQYTPNRTALEMFLTTWGKDTLKWIGKKFEVTLVQVNVFGKLKNSIVPRIPTKELVKVIEQPQVETVKM